MKHKSFALENIKKHEKRKAKELLLTIGYHCAEVLTAVGIFALGIAIITIL